VRVAHLDFDCNSGLQHSGEEGSECINVIHPTRSPVSAQSRTNIIICSSKLTTYKLPIGSSIAATGDCLTGSSGCNKCGVQLDSYGTMKSWNPKWT
jgi:hypothetical protein